MDDTPHHEDARRAGRRQWLAVGIIALLVVVMYIGGYFVLTRTVDPPGLNRVRVFPGRAARVIWSPLFWAERHATGIGAAIDDGSGTAQVEDEFETIMIDTSHNEQ
ncbi:MAG: hypothetical protein GC159_03780 [Phycisphaera sp.]|nr:hypothetical protein [Phycisphaera sp.]